MLSLSAVIIQIYRGTVPAKEKIFSATLLIVSILFNRPPLMAQRLKPFGLEGKTVTILAVSPVNSSSTWNRFLFAGTDSCGIFARDLSSPDSGWVSIGLADKNISALGVYHWGVGPADFNTLFTGVVPDRASGDSTLLYQYTENGIWIPADSGIDHKQMRYITNMDGFFYSGHEPPQPLFIGGNFGFYRSFRMGESWEKIWDPPGLIQMLKADQRRAHLWAGGSWGRDDFYPWIARSDDFGLTWERFDLDAGGPNAVLSLTFYPNSPDTVYAGLQNIVMKTMDNGKSWHSITPDKFPVYFKCLALDSGNPEHIWAGGPLDETYLAIWSGTFALWESYDGGKNWAAVKPNLQPEPSAITALISDPKEAGVVYIATKGGGVWQYTNPARLPRTIRVPEELQTIQSAINVSMTGDTILVGPGRYEENINFHGKGILLVSAKGNEETIIDGAQTGSVITFDSGEDSTACIKGFTICNGSGTSLADGHLYGGGIYCFSASPRILYNVITKNHLMANCGAYGGGIALLGNSHPVVQGNRFTQNGTSSLCDALINYGGAVYVGGDSSPLLSENIIFNNYADFGSGIAVLDAARPIFQKNRIFNNHANNILVDEGALPVIGGYAGKGNDIYQNPRGGRGSCLLRFGNGVIINAQYNYFGDCPPGENEIYPLDQFNAQNCSDWPVRDYFPMQIGNCWTFGQTIPKSSKHISTFSETIIDTLTVGGQHFFRFDQFRELERPLLRLTAEDRLTWRFDPMGVLEHIWVNFAADTGDRWQVNTGYENWSVELLSKTDIVTVPAGTFDNCYRYHFHFQGADNDWDEWYAPGIGPVKRILYGFAVIEYPLVSAQVHGIQVPAAKHSPKSVPAKPTLYQNYPNPFNSETEISFSMKKACHVKLTVYDLRGREILILVNEYKQPSEYTVHFNATGLSSGIYLYKLDGGDEAVVKKMVLTR